MFNNNHKQWLETLEEEIERRDRVERATNSFEDFCNIYYDNTGRMSDITPQLHREIRELATNKDLDDWYYIDEKTDNKLQKKGLIIAAPRGHSKTTILTFFLTLWWSLTKRKEFIILIGSSAFAAAENVNDLREELEGNDLIRNDFGDVVGSTYGFKWTQSDITVTHTDPITRKVTHTCRIVAKSPGARIRGIKHRGKRPDGIIVDDLESDEIVRNPETISKISNWLNGAAVPALQPGCNDFIVIGTILHFDSVLARLLSARFKDIYVQRVYRAYWDDRAGIRHYLWPERFTPAILEMERKRMGQLQFNAEYLNNPVDPETRKFRPEWIRWYTRKDLEYKQGNWYYQGQLLKIIQGVDPAIKEKDQTNNDYYAHITIGVTEESNITKRQIVVLWPYHDHLDFPQQVQQIIKQFNTYPKTERIGIETTAYQAALKQQVLLQELLPIYQIKHDRGKTDKMARLTAMSVFFENGQILLRAADDSEAGDLDELQMVRVHPQFREMYDSLMRYPLILHDDLVDALEMCVNIAKRNRAFEDFRLDAPQQLGKNRPEQHVFGPYDTGKPPKAPFLDDTLQPLPGWSPSDATPQRISKGYDGW